MNALWHVFQQSSVSQWSDHNIGEIKLFIFNYCSVFKDHLDLFLQDSFASTYYRYNLMCFYSLFMIIYAVMAVCLVSFVYSGRTGFVKLLVFIG